MTVTSAGLVGIGTAPAQATLDVNGAVSANATYEGISTYVNSTATYTIPDLSVNIRRITLTASTTITLPAFTAPTGKVAQLTVFLQQNGTGNFSATFVGSASDVVKWDTGGAPLISPTANKISILQFLKPADEAVWYGSMVWREN